MENQYTELNGPKVLLKYKSEFMENYVAESNIDLGADIKVIGTVNDKVLVFVINKQNELILLTRTDAEGDAWTQLRLSVKGQQVTAFDVLHQDTVNAIRIAYAAKTGQENSLWLSSHVVLDAENTPMDGLAYQSYQLEDRERTLHSISISDVGILFSSDKPKTDAKYHLIGDDGLIKAFHLPENNDRILQLTLGTWRGHQGVFSLYDLKGKRTMLFQGFSAAGEKEIFQQRFMPNYRPNCFFVLKNVGENDQLFVAGSSITHYKDARSKAVEICGNDFEFSQLDVSQEDGAISVWALDNKSRQLKLIRRETDHEKRIWSEPVAMHGDTDRFSSLRGEHLSNHLFLFDQSKGGKLTEIWQDAVSGCWHEHLLGIADLSSSRLINTYTLDLYFEKHDLENKIEENINLTSKANTFIYLDDIKYQLQAGVPLPIPYASYLNIMCPLDSLAFPELVISSGLFEQELHINPGHPVSTALGEKISSAEDLRNARKQNGELLVPTHIDHELLSQVASATSTLTTNQNIQAALAVHHGQELGFWESIGEGLQDLLFSIKKGFITVKEFIVEKAEQAWKFTLKIGNKLYQWIGDTLNDVFSFLERVWEKIGVLFKDLVDYLSFLFSWQDIIDAKDALKLTANQAIEGLKPGVEKLRALAVGQVQDWHRRASIALRNLGTPSYTVNDLPKEKINGHNDKLDSRTNWVGSKQELLFNTKPSTANGVDREALANMDTSAKDPVMTRLGDLLKKFLASQITLGALIKEFAAIMLDVVFELIEEVINWLFDLIIKSIDLIKGMLNAEIKIPLLSSIYRKISHAELSILDFTCLLCAIPMTIGYKIAFGEAPFSRLSKERFAENMLQNFNLA
ncbi:hypothetical protein [Pedobacter sp. KLB.chiD]|uniref:hypothetical protein n=1 Tax=Pedobacter sp. KLB.chiD TaxID=3387402 RepID=UPI00399C1AA1